MNTTISRGSTATSNIADYAIQDLDHLGLVAGMVDELKIAETIDTLIVQDLNQRHVSVGLAVKAMILNGLGFIQRVLYLMPMFFMNKPLERLLGSGITAEQLNDDTLGRALDAIYKYGVGQLYSQVATKAVNLLRSCR
jgi:transposase